MFQKIVFLITGLLFLAPCAFADTPGFTDVLNSPSMKTPLAMKSLFNGITVAGKRLIGVGQRGHIIYSDDGGKKWIQAQSPVSSDLVAVHFPSSKKGWAVGHDGVVLHSADGGVSWTKQLDGYAVCKIIKNYYKEHPPTTMGSESMTMINRLIEEGAAKSFLDVWFDDESNGFIVGSFNLIFRTTDGGKNWEPLFDRTENPKYLHFYAVKRVGLDIFIAGEQGTILKLDQATGKYRRLNIPYHGTLFGIVGVSGKVIAYGMRGNVVHSSDRGANWRKIDTGVPVGLTGGTITYDGQIIIVSQTGNVLVSKDGGVSFKMAETEKYFPAAAVICYNKNTLVLVGFGGVDVRSIQ